MVTFNNLFREGYDQYDIRLDGNVASVQAICHSGGSIRNTVYSVLGSDLKKEDDVASLDQVREDLGYTGFTLRGYADGGLTSNNNKKEDKMALTFWDSLKLISPEVGEQFETEQEYRDAVLSAGQLLHASESLEKLDAVYGSAEVCDGSWVEDFANFVYDDEKNTEENN